MILGVAVPDLAHPLHWQAQGPRDRIFVAVLHHQEGLRNRITEELNQALSATIEG